MFCLETQFLLKPFSIAHCAVGFHLIFQLDWSFSFSCPLSECPLSRQKWACLEILMRKIVAIAADLSFSGRQVCSYQCPSISSLCAPDTIGNRYKQLYFPPNVPRKYSIFMNNSKTYFIADSLRTVLQNHWKFLQYSKLSHWTLLMPKWVGVIYCPMNYKDLLGPRVIKDHLLKYNSNKSFENESTTTIGFGIDIGISNTTTDSTSQEKFHSQTGLTLIINIWWTNSFGL